MYKRLSTLLLVFFLGCSCTHPLDRKISDDNAHEYLDEICEKMNKPQYVCLRLREDYILVLASKERGKDGRVAIVHQYGKTFEQLTFRDLKDNPL